MLPVQGWAMLLSLPFLSIGSASWRHEHSSAQTSQMSAPIPLKVPAQQSSATPHTLRFALLIAKKIIQANVVVSLILSPRSWQAMFHAGLCMGSASSLTVQQQTPICLMSLLLPLNRHNLQLALCSFRQHSTLQFLLMRLPIGLQHQLVSSSAFSASVEHLYRRVAP